MSDDRRHDAWLQAAWPAPPNVHAGTTLRTGPGVSVAPFDRCNLGANSGDDPAAVASNRAALVTHMQLPSQPRWLHQIHGTQVHRFAKDDAHTPVADAAVTSTPGVVLAVLTADCLPVVFVARDGSEVAVAHAGWRGLAAGVLEQTLRAMHAPAAQVIAWLGPAAGPRAYEVGRDVHAAFVTSSGSDQGRDVLGDSFTATRPGHWHVDLHALARARLDAAGIAWVHGADHCTITDAAHFYSYRRDGRTGRMATLAWLDPILPG